MLQRLFENTNKYGGKYNFYSLLHDQVRSLVASGLVEDFVGQHIKEEFESRNLESRINSFSSEYKSGIIPFIICPNPTLFSIPDLLKRISLGGNPTTNTFFLDAEKIHDLWPASKSDLKVAHFSCGIEIGIRCEPRSNYNFTKIRDEEDLSRIQNQQPDKSMMNFWEGLMLSFYYPDIYDVWNGIELLGSSYGENSETLRLYWLNNKPTRYLKIAKETHPLNDTRFVSPRIKERIIV